MKSFNYLHLLFTAAVICSAGPVGALTLLNPDFSNVSRLGGGGINDVAPVGTQYQYTNVGTINVGGVSRSVNAFLVIDSSNVTQINRVLDDGRIGFQFNNQNENGQTAQQDAFIQTTINFVFSDTGADASISNLFAFSSDVDSSNPSSSNPIYSDLVGVDNTHLDRVEFSGTSQLVEDTAFSSGFTSTRLGDFTDGNHNPTNPTASTSVSQNLLDYSADFRLQERSNYTFIFGVTGEDSDQRANRIIGIQLDSSATIVPEPSAVMLSALGLSIFILRKKR